MKPTNLNGKLHKINNFKRLLELTKPHLKKMVLAALCVIVVNSAELLKPYILKLVIDDFLVKKISRNGINSITLMGIVYFAVASIGSLSSFTQVNLINKAGQQIMKELRKNVFRTIQFLPLSYLDKNSSGRLITRATNDVEALSELYTDVIINSFKDVFLLVGIVYVMLSLNIELALISFSVVPIMFFII